MSVLVQLLADSTKPLTEPMLTDNQWGPGAFESGQFNKKSIDFRHLIVFVNYPSEITPVDISQGSLN